VRFRYAIVTALEKERLAVEALLEPLQGGIPNVAADDPNIYSFGSLFGHPVVLASLPGTYGESSVAVVTTNLICSFPSVENLLMVGIAGGPGCKMNNVRLGDIIVSDRKGGGVWQYDMGHDEKDKFEPKWDPFPLPSDFMMQATQKLGIAVQLEGFDKAIGQWIEKVPTAFPDAHTRALYSRPNVADVQFDSSFEHIGDSENCIECLKNAPENKKQAVEKKKPEVHYGPIASGNTVMKNAEHRDRLQMAKGFVGFEMESAGFVQAVGQKGYILIRGICDYSDTHKNKEWQEYAAACAAGYAAALLRQIRPSENEA